MNRDLHPLTVRLIDRCIQLFLRKFRDIATVARQDLDPVSSRTQLSSDSGAHAPRAVRLLDPILMSVSAGHADTCVRMDDTRNRHIPLLPCQTQLLHQIGRTGQITHRRDAEPQRLFRLFQRIVCHHIIVIIIQIRLAVVVAKMHMHIKQSRQDRRLAVILYHLFRVAPRRFRCVSYPADFSLFIQIHRLILQAGSAISGN